MLQISHMELLQEMSEVNINVVVVSNLSNAMSTMLASSVWLFTNWQLLLCIFSVHEEDFE